MCVLFCIMLKHVWQTVYIQIVLVRKITVRICFRVYGQIRLDKGLLLNIEL
jgi:hypothetical protein